LTREGAAPYGAPTAVLARPRPGGIRAIGTMGNEDGDSSGDELVELDALDESDDDFAYEEIDIDEDDPLLLAEEDDFDSALRSLAGLGGSLVGAKDTGPPDVAPGEVIKKPEVSRARPTPDPFRRHFRILTRPREPPA